MANKRQREARKRFRTEHPELVRTPKPTPPKDPTKKKTNKVKKSTSFKKSSRSKHPLRVLGMKPGDSCFICKGSDHITKMCPVKAEWDRHKICLNTPLAAVAAA